MKELKEMKNLKAEIFIIRNTVKILSALKHEERGIQEDIKCLKDESKKSKEKDSATSKRIKM